MQYDWFLSDKQSSTLLYIVVIRIPSKDKATLVHNFGSGGILFKIVQAEKDKT